MKKYFIWRALEQDDPERAKHIIIYQTLFKRKTIKLYNRLVKIGCESKPEGWYLNISLFDKKDVIIKQHIERY